MIASAQAYARGDDGELMQFEVKKVRSYRDAIKTVRAATNTQRVLCLIQGTAGAAQPQQESAA